MIHRPLPSELYVDTSVFVGAIFQGAPHSASCYAFSQRLIAAQTHVYYSQLVRVELLQAVRRLATTQHNLPLTVRARYRLDLWGSDENVRRAWIELGIREFDVLL